MDKNAKEFSLPLSNVHASLRTYFDRETPEGVVHRGVVMAAIMAVVLLLLLTLYAHYIRQQALIGLEARLIAQTHLRSEGLLVPIDNARRNVRFLAQVPAVQGLVRAGENHGFDSVEQSSYEAWQRRLAALFVGFASANPDVTQVRLIGLGNNGLELVRVDRKNDQVIIAGPAALQSKGTTAYFMAASKLKVGEVYISDVNLNRERQKLEVPYVPTVRAATPVFDSQGHLFGVVVINFKTDAMLAALSNNLSNNFQVYLSNSNGDYLASPNFADNFGFDLGMRHVWSDDFTLLDQSSKHLHRYQSSTYPLRGKVYVYTLKLALDSHNPQRVLNLSMVAPQAFVTSEMYGRLAILCGAILGSVLLMGSMFYIYWRQRLKAEAAQARVVAIVESSTDAIIGLSMTGIITNWNKSAEQMFGYPAALVVGEKEHTFCRSRITAKEEAEYLTRIARGQTVVDIESICTHHNGHSFDVSISLAPIRDANHRVIGISKTVRDITEQKQAGLRIQRLNESLEEQVVERTEKIEAYSRLQRAILDNAGLAIIAVDAEGQITLFNPAAAKMLGYSAEEMLGQTPDVFHDPTEITHRAAELTAELGVTVTADMAVFTTKAFRGLADEREWTFIRKDGSHLPVYLSITGMRGSSGNIKGYLWMALDISQQQLDRQRMQLLSDHFKKAAEVADLGIWTWGIQDNTLVWNARMLEMYSVPQEIRDQQLYYDFWQSSLHPDDVEDAVSKLNAAVEGHSFYDTSFRIVAPDGSIRYIQAAALLEFAEDGTPLRMLGINRDVTMQREQEASLRAAMTNAHEANQAKSAFLANMSHEIRTPMNAILGMQQLLHLTLLDGRQFDYVSKTEAAAQTLLGILNDILDFSKVEAGKLSLDEHAFNFDKLLRDVGTILAGNIGQKEVEVLFDIDATVPAWLKGDALRLQQVLINLAGNAIKFTEHGEVVLAVHLQRFTDMPPRLLIEVRDTGIGIPEEIRQHIFEGFSQAESSTARRYGGSGLGLAISQRLVRLMGGDISFDSTEGVGTTFRFSIPCVVAEGVEIPSAHAIAELHGLRVLVVDDNSYARQVMVNMVHQFGWQSHEAANGLEALIVLADCAVLEQHFDVVLVDWRMPEMDGWETTAQIHALYNDRVAPLVVMVTAADRSKNNEQQAMLDGQLDGYLIKPITASMLFDAVADARAGHHRFASVAIPRLTEQRLLGIHILVVEDNPTNQQVARELLSVEGARVSVADSGLVAMEAVLQADHIPDIVLMDIQMPDMDGYTATRFIRRTISADKLPIIALTANAMASDRALALAAGMNDHVGKPFDLNELVTVICTQLGRPIVQVPAASVQSDETTQSELIHPLDVSLALQRFGGNTVVYGRALRSFAFDASALLARLMAAGAAQEDELRHILHALKGLASTIGASQLAVLAAEAEKAGHDEFLARWPLLQHTALHAIQQAEQQAELYVDQQQAHEVVGDAVHAPPVIEGLDTLSRLLRDSNMEALGLFDQLHHQYGSKYPLAFVQLAQAVSQLNFPQALRYCEELKRLVEGSEI